MGVDNALGQQIQHVHTTTRSILPHLLLESRHDDDDDDDDYYDYDDDDDNK